MTTRIVPEPACPGCNEVQLTYGRQLCQACKVLQIMRERGQLPPDREARDDTCR